MSGPGDGVGSNSLELDPDPSPGLQEENLNNKQLFSAGGVSVICYYVTVLYVITQYNMLNVLPLVTLFRLRKYSVERLWTNLFFIKIYVKYCEILFELWYFEDTFDTQSKLHYKYIQ